VSGKLCTTSSTAAKLGHTQLDHNLATSLILVGLLPQIAPPKREAPNGHGRRHDRCPEMIHDSQSDAVRRVNGCNVMETVARAHPGVVERFNKLDLSD